LLVVWQMDCVPINSNVEGVEYVSADQLLSSCSSDTPDIFRDPTMLPRVGAEYQAEIPPLIAKCDSSQLINKPTNSEVNGTPPASFLLGMPIPLMWVNSVGTVELESTEESQITSNNGCEDPKVKPLDSVVECEKGIGSYLRHQPTLESSKMDVDSVLPRASKTKLDQVGRDFCPLPGSLGESWTHNELDCFLLGLYLFGKKFILVKKFIENKEMGDILSFYYGKFYMSAKHRRWSKCRKSRRGITGENIFTEWRQTELLSRLRSQIPEESHNMLLEASKKFNDDKNSLEEYVFTLKDTVGTNVLVEAVGIGKGKQDLTRNAVEASQVSSVRLNMPSGKACASLTSADIIKFLTGDCRLSKTRSSDLFWEAVWPRLLARGWHSEQPKDLGISGLKHSLVFLVPGVKNFSRRLVKGKHYLDSISDILNKVASKPELLELEIETAQGSGHEEEYRCNPDGESNKQHRRYLQPRNSTCSGDVVKVTIVDTSLVKGAKRRKVRDLRSIPVQTTSVSSPSSHSSQAQQDASENFKAEFEETSTSNREVNVINGGAFADPSECLNTVLNTDAMDPTMLENHEIHSTSSDYDKQRRNAGQYQSRPEGKCGGSNYLAPVSKRQSLTRESDCSIENVTADRKLNEDDSHYRLNSPGACDTMAFANGPSQLSPANSLAEGSPGWSNEGIVKENCLAREASPENLQPCVLIDLNVPHISPDTGTDEPFMTGMMQNDVNSCADEPSFLSESSQQREPLNLSDNGASKDQQPIINNWRHSTRNRPLTTKALEALAFGFYSPKKRKVAEATQNKSMSRSSR
ncbi:hypothetical protein CFOL_v3_26807, partial [Cephalotus follicularis]